MEELLRTSFTLGQQWVQDMNNDKEPINFNDWYSSDEIQAQIKLLNLDFVINLNCEQCGGTGKIFIGNNTPEEEIDCIYCKQFCL